MGGPWRCLLLLLLCTVKVAVARSPWLTEDGRIKLPTGASFPHRLDDAKKEFGTKWALLIAGSSGYGNYRHQADVCHAYQLLHNNGLKDENIVVMMFDDIAYNPENPRPGVIINHPDGLDMYKNVPKDYTGRDVNVKNFLAVLRGNKTAVQGVGSGKVIASGPEDHVFVYYTDHGGPGVLGMPNLPFLFASDILSTLKAKHAAKGYKELVFYLEACESGSIFEGLLPEDMDIYATTAANSMESSWGCYCPGMDPGPPPEYETCLGDLYSIAWMEDSDYHNLAKESLYDQFKIVRDRTSNHGTFERGSHVMQYGEREINEEECAEYLGTNPENDDASYPVFPDGLSTKGMGIGLQMFYEGKKAETVAQRDAELLHLWHKYKNAVDGSDRKSAALRELQQATSERNHIDRSVKLITQLLVGSGNDANSLREARKPAGLPLVDDWDCLKGMVRAYENHCGLLSQYGMKHMRVFANICNRNIAEEEVSRAAMEVCSDGVASWGADFTLHRTGGFSA